MKLKPINCARDKYQAFANSHRRETDVLQQSIKRLGQANVPQAAAGMAYYALFSLFPLLLLLIVVISAVLENQAVQQQVLLLLNDVIPVSQQFVQENIQQVLNSRGSISVIGVITLFWSASSFFSALVSNIDAAWPETERRSFVGRRLLAFAMVVGLACLILASLSVRGLAQLLPALSHQLSLDVQVFRSLAWKAGAVLLPLLLRFLIFLALYRLVPATRVSWRAATGSAGVAFILWEGVTYAFTWYITSGTATYQLVYGSVGRLVALLFWIYLGSLSVLLGAHLCAAIDALHNTADA